MLQKVKHYLSLVKFSHTIFALPFAAIGFILAIVQYQLELQGVLAIKILLCMVFARSAAMAFNRWTDRDIDALNARTKIREIPAGIIKENEALVFTILNCIAFVVTTWFINPLCFYLSFVALAIILGYSLTKRFTALCHFVLGLGLSLAPLGAWIAVSGKFDYLPLLFSFAVLTWVSGFDIIYALQDEQFDKEHNLHSIPQYFGGKKALSLSRKLHMASSLFILSAGFNGGFGIIYFIGWAFFTGLLMYQHRLVKHDDLSKVNLAFFTTNGIASLVFSIFVVSDVIFNSSYSLF
ncbi:MAG: UbiA family prenyltransferase [Bacteroidetes bacterium]|nr:UbiA family prenyltransferase [Bacteroidota bacterium]